MTEETFNLEDRTPGMRVNASKLRAINIFIGVIKKHPDGFSANEFRDAMTDESVPQTDTKKMARQMFRTFQSKKLIKKTNQFVISKYGATCNSIAVWKKADREIDNLRLGEFFT
jgi:hypothetical protein